MSLTAPGPRSPIVRWSLVVALMGYAGIAHFNRVGISVAGSDVFIPELGISETQMGWVYTAFLIVYTCSMLPGGWLIDRLGAARTLALFGLSMGSLVALTGAMGFFSGSAQQLWLGLLLIRGLAGGCNAPLHPGAAHVVSDIATGRGQPTANGMVTAGALLGIACCYPAFGWLIDHMGWPLAFVVSGLGLVVYGLAWACTAWRVLPASHAPQVVPLDAHDTAQPPAVLASGWTLVKHRDLYLLTFSYAAFGYFQYLFFYWMQYYFERVLEVPDTTSRQAAFCITLAQGAGMAIGGYGTDVVCDTLGVTWGRRGIVMTGMGLAGVFGCLALAMDSAGQVAFCLALSMAALGICEGVFWTTATDLGGRARGMAGAFMNTGGNVGGLISPTLTPILATRLGWTGAIAVACAISLAGGLVWFWIKPDVKRDWVT